MGIYDREYYRDEPSGPGWFSGIAPACKTIILVNVVVFVAQVLYEPLTDLLEARSGAIFQQFQVWRLLTAAFIHNPNEPFHILWNMVFLWMAGREIESIYGHRDFTAMYLCAAIFSTLCWAFLNYADPDRGVRSIGMLGASGAVLAVVTLFTLFYPRRQVLLFFVLPVEVWLLLAVYIAYDAWQLLHGALTNEAVAAHLGGAAFGFLFKVGNLRWSRLGIGRARRPKLRLVMPEPRDRPTVRPSSGPTWSPDLAAATMPVPTAVLPEEQLDARLDEILAKIARDGRESLNDDDHRVLQEASRRARNRRSDRP